MLRKSAAILFGAVLSLVVTFPVLADAPAEGVVVEGESVPGVALGDTRAQVEAAWGQPYACQDLEVSGDLAFCLFSVAGGGSVSVRYRGPDGRNARNAPDDVVYRIRWTKPVSGWTTSAGINTANALADRQAVADAYPNAEVTYDGFGNIIRVEDAQLGILVIWHYDTYTATTDVNMAIFLPETPAPPGDKVLTVTDIELTVDKHRGRRHVTAVLQVEDDLGLPVAGATVSITWTYPRGATQSVDDVTSDTGYAFFEIYDADRGTWTLTVDDAVLDGYQFDRDNSVLSASIRVK